MATDMGELRLHPLFPRSPKECKIVADIFFTCFTTNSQKLTAVDTEAGERGLNMCLKEKVAYDKCMDNYDEKAKQLFRVN